MYIAIRRNSMKASLYGEVCLRKEYCSMCASDSFVIDNKRVCCDSDSSDTQIEEIKRESVHNFKLISPKLKRKIIEIQKGRCYICGVFLGERNFYRNKKGRFQLLKMNFDHFIPKSLCAINIYENIYLMCNLCNSIKSNNIFDTREDAIRYIVSKRKNKGTMEIYSEYQIFSFGGDYEIM